MKRILIRFDDLNQFMSIDILKEIKKTCREYKNSVLLCIIPFCADKNLNPSEDLGEFFWETMRYCQKQKSVIGLHGFTHKLYKNTKKQIFPISSQTELCGRSLDEQRKILLKGKTFLENNGLNVRFFAPPAHSMDKNTIKALHEIGLDTVSDSFFSSCTMWQGLRWIPLKTWRESTIFFGSLSTICKHPSEIKGKYKFSLKLKKNYTLANFDQEILNLNKYNFNEKILHIIYSLIFIINRYFRSFLENTKIKLS